MARWNHTFDESLEEAKAVAESQHYQAFLIAAETHYYTLYHRIEDLERDVFTPECAACIAAVYIRHNGFWRRADEIIRVEK